ncbi:putative jacalin-like lectin domain-containing protein [Helianthus annuus]|uniref:Jacalin-like lectin domain-containing protein n=2 Tax=Helianthus annuus TaxID=4232 RepID=A0A9K3E6R7_HELAN|nr:mannose/glucose-specific lectin [Helianthus annuus]KAF5768020.1 putative jacalin-like lectin domain-containing protein [Helianthus annuus]KAJ0467436.1 putative jacalin-like lectin domain-containing protein [Helianthus annuus]KAJ0484834.1 putative jacalin-like lectin domain-containing protein [Helianthus annuus]KAJ0655385.1 putative jacalin-like lectin domain-containing protein [Helianthus annuus]KAJ0839346.1 putative jacalin-like lectin domain-containing protein [Helianthus annuus]
MAGVLQNISIPRAGFIRVEPRGQFIGQPQSNWSFEIQEGHKLKSIKIDHGDRIIHSLQFTTEFGGALSISDNFGSLVAGQNVSLVTLEADEEIVGIKVSIGIKGRDTYLSSLSFVTNKTTHGPFGGTTDPMFSLPWDKGSLVGFYGIASDWVRGIGGLGVYLKAHGEVLSIGPWGSPYDPQTRWSFLLEGNQRLSTITIFRTGDAINRLVFNTSEKVDGRSGVSVADLVVLDADEEIIGLSGMVDTLPTRHIIISSITFTTNKKVHGPFGNAKGSPFSVSWDIGSFAGFYGFQSLYFDGIGVYLKATN